MAIIREFFKTRKDGVNLVRTYSDKGVYIQKDGTDEVYAEAIDVENTEYTYSETETPIVEEGLDEEE